MKFVNKLVENWSGSGYLEDEKDYDSYDYDSYDYDCEEDSSKKEIFLGEESYRNFCSPYDPKVVKEYFKNLKPRNLDEEKQLIDKYNSVMEEVKLYVKNHACHCLMNQGRSGFLQPESRRVEQIRNRGEDPVVNFWISSAGTC